MAVKKNFDSIPIIDIGDLYGNNKEKRMSVASEIGDAARNVGFFIIKGHHIHQDIMDGLLTAAKDFFSTPEEYRKQYLIGLNGFHNGYIPIGGEGFGNEVPDLKESFYTSEDLDPNDPVVRNQKFPLMGPVNWPDIPQFKERVSKYFEEARCLGQYLWRGFALALGLTEESFTDEFQLPPCFFRINHYPQNDEDADSLGMSPHTDYEAFTILLTMQEGLEVMNDKYEWIEVPRIPGTFVVNIGDALELMTAGKFVATTHRVRKVNEERYSFPLFFSRNHTNEVKPLPQFDGESAKYTATTIGDHLWACLVKSHKYLAQGVEEGKFPAPNEKGIRNYGRLN